jgi:hypothetical protein
MRLKSDFWSLTGQNSYSNVARGDETSFLAI